MSAAAGGRGSSTRSACVGVRGAAVALRLAPALALSLCALLAPRAQARARQRHAHRAGAHAQAHAHFHPPHRAHRHAGNPPHRRALLACRRRALAQSLALRAAGPRAASYRGVINAGRLARGSAQATADRRLQAGVVRLSITETFSEGSLRGTLVLRYRRLAKGRFAARGALALSGTIGATAVTLRGRATGRASIGGGVALALKIVGHERLCPLPLSTPLAWSAPMAVAPGRFLAAVACPAPGQCTAVADYPGAQVTFDPRRRSVRSPVSIDPQAALIGSLACPIRSQCTALDGAGRELTFDPLAGAASSPIAIDAAQPEALDCPSPSQCTAVDDLQGEITFDPATLQTSSPPPPWSMLGGGVLSGISCPSAVQCTALSPGQEVTFDPLTAAVSTRVTLQTNGSLEAIDCPTISQCTAVGAGGVQLTFDPAEPRHRRQAIVAGSDALTAISCPAQRRCVAVTANGRAITFDPQAPARRVLHVLAPGSPAPALTGVSCPSVAECVAVDGAGRAFIALSPSPRAGR